MQANDKFLIENDCFTRRTPPQWAEGSNEGLNPVFEIVLAPRCTRLLLPFVHATPAQFYTLKGRALFEVDSNNIRLDQDQYVFIPANTPYFFRGLDNQSTIILAQPASVSAEADWQSVAAQIRQLKVARMKV